MIEIRFTENFLKQQVKCLDILAELIEYDKQHGNPPEVTRVLAAFIDTQRKALDMASKLLEKHKPALEEAEKAEREKQQAQEKIEAAKRKEEQKKEKVKEDLKKAASEEGSLFSCNEADEEAKTQELEEEADPEDDGYAFEEDEDNEE